MTKLRWRVDSGVGGRTAYAYLGNVTIGYIVERKPDEHVWQVSGVYMKWIAKGYGESKTFEAARRALTRAWRKWCERAGLNE